MRFQKTFLVALASAAFLAACGDDDGGGGGVVYTDDGLLTVMTRNLYLGADLTPVLVATTAEGLLTATAGVFTAVTQTNDFQVRVQGIANEIAATRPDLVGLQEVSLFRVQSPGDRAAGGTTPATTVLIDFLALLRTELASRGVPYDVAAEIDLFDLEAPVPITTTVPPATIDVRLTDRQVILAISGLPTSNPRSSVFSALLPLTALDPTTGGTTTISITRGWTAVNATVGGKQVAFYNTHLEAFGEPIRDLQAAELSVLLDVEPVTSVVLVGDLNSDPAGRGQAGSAAYDILVAGVTGGPFTDLWTNRNPADDGLTCCFDPNLQVTTTTLVSRIDHILWKGTLPPVSATRVGEDLADRVGTPARWPSDHVGVVGVFDP